MLELGLMVPGLSEFEARGVRYLYAAVSDAHLRLMRGRLKNVDIVPQFKCRIGEHLFNWILLVARGQADATTVVFAPPS